MRRREFLAALAGASFLLPVGAGAQQSTKVYRIAMLHPSHPVAEMTENSSLRYFHAFFQELRRLGYVEGRNVLIERYSGEGRVENYASLIHNVVSRNFDLIFAMTAGMAMPLINATSKTPIVAISSDPINDGLVTSLAHPGPVKFDILRRPPGGAHGIRKRCIAPISASWAGVAGEIAPASNGQQSMFTPHPVARWRSNNAN
jgi:ABC transporter substrate binding protein